MAKTPLACRGISSFDKIDDRIKIGSGVDEVQERRFSAPYQ